MVNNPDPADRLHLRAKAAGDAKSLGKYYNGTPVYVLEQKGAWAHVSIFGIEGWMMKKYLAFGDAMHSVAPALPSRAAAEAEADLFVYATAEAKNPIENLGRTQRDLLVLAIADDNWYHVWFPDLNLTGYVLQAEWREGNG